jgi:hypothetical protein
MHAQREGESNLIQGYHIFIAHRLALRAGFLVSGSDAFFDFVFCEALELTFDDGGSGFAFGGTALEGAFLADGMGAMSTPKM